MNLDLYRVVVSCSQKISADLSALTLRTRTVSESWLSDTVFVRKVYIVYIVNDVNFLTYV